MNSREVRFNNAAALLTAISILFLAAPRSRAQELQELGHFWAMKGTVQLLPTGNVLKREDGKVSVYTFKHQKYTVDNRLQLPKEITTWTYFDWQSVDWSDQIDRNDSDIPDGTFWPQNGKVKKILYLSARNGPVISALVCYTVAEPKEERQLLSTAGQIWVIAVRGNRTDSGYKYQKLWAKKLETQSNYGELSVQQLPDLGRVLVLYSASAGGSSESEQLDIYKLE
jgi:hypothetical protein